MNVPLPMFVAVPLVVAFLLPMLPRAGKAIATLLANAATICLLVFAVMSVGEAKVYESVRSAPRPCCSAPATWSNTPPSRST